MTTATVNFSEIAAFWRTSRRLYTIYSELNRTFEIGLPLCTELEYPIDRSEPEVIARVRRWLAVMDDKVQTWQLRQLLQSTNLQTEENLRALTCRYLDKESKTDIDRDKIDFLLVQYFAHCAPQSSFEQTIPLSDVARVLEPILNVVPQKFPEWTADIDQKLETLNQCNSLEELQKSNALVDVRELKLSLGEHYLDVPALVAFTRFNFLARRAFFRAMHLDLHAIRVSLGQLEGRGVTTLDCRDAGLTELESLEHVRHVIHQWKTPFRAPYSGGNSFQPLVALRHALERVLQEFDDKAKHIAEAEEKAPAEPKPSAPASVPQRQSDQPAAFKPEKKTELQAEPQKGKAAASVAAPTPSSEADGHPEQDMYLEQCIGDLTRQIMAAPPKHGASVTPITLAGCKLLIATWEAEAFTRGNDELSSAIQRAVAARTILHVCVDRHKKQEPTDLFVALEIAHLAVEEMRQQVARAKEAKNIDAAVSLAATTKRLLGLITEGEKLCN
ncbi:MAG TPA: hypothetical protein VJA94_20405 [Candidatus Angelobacter sp.]